MKRLSYILISIALMMLLISCSVFKKTEKREERKFEQSESKAASFREAMQFDIEHFGGQGLSGYLPFSIARDPHLLPIEERSKWPPAYKVESGDLVIEFVQNDTGIKYTAVPKPVARSSLKYKSENEAKTKNDSNMELSELYEFTRQVKNVPGWVWLLLVVLLLAWFIYKIIRPKIRFPF
ncbi:hypothetical protein [Peijinzhouia sedimentorum]